MVGCTLHVLLTTMRIQTGEKECLQWQLVAQEGLSALLLHSWESFAWYWESQEELAEVFNMPRRQELEQKLLFGPNCSLPLQFWFLQFTKI